MPKTQSNPKKKECKDPALLSEIKAFLTETGVAATTLGTASLGDGHIVKQLENGRRVWPETAQKIRDWMVAERERRLKAAEEKAA